MFMRTIQSFLRHVIAACLCTAGAAHAADLLDIYRLASENDPEIRAAAAAHAAAQEVRPKNLSLLLPQISASVDTARIHEEISETTGGLLPDSRSAFNNQGYGLSLIQSIYRHDYYALLRQAGSRIAKADADYGAAQQNLILRSAERYFDVLAAEENLTFAHSEMESLALRLEQVKQRYEVGASTITVVQEVQARYDLSVAQEITAINKLDSAREALHALTGGVHEALSMVVEQLPLAAPDPQDMAPWVNMALQQNLKLLAAQAVEETAREEVTRQRAGHLPSLDLVASHRFDDVGGGSFGERKSKDNSVGVRLNIPLLSGGLVIAQTHEAEQLYIQTREQRMQTQRAVERAARDAYRGVTASISIVQALKQAVTSNETALEAVDAGYEAGTRTIVDVLNAQSNLYRAKHDYADARYNYLLNTLLLKQAVGALIPKDLEQMNAYLTAPAGKADK